MGQGSVDYPLNIEIGKTSFSGQDVRVYGMLSGAGRNNINRSSLVFLDSIHTISVSSFREKVPVRACGHVNAKNFTRGPRTIAGSIICTIVGRHPFFDLMLDTVNYDFSYDDRYRRTQKDPRFYPDYLPPINLTLRFSNELGNNATLFIIGVDLINDGMTVAVDDIITETTYQYVARDVICFAHDTQRAGATLGIPEWIPTEFVPIDFSNIGVGEDGIIYDWMMELQKYNTTANANAWKLPIPKSSMSSPETTRNKTEENENTRGLYGPSL